MEADSQQRKADLITMLSAYCDKRLNNEYKELCIKIAIKMSRKRRIPFLKGKMEIWAAAIIYAIGQINFLFDQSFEPYNTPDDICNYFHTSKSTTSQKAKTIRDTFALGYFDQEFSTKKIIDSDPMRSMIIMNGIIVPKEFMDNDNQQ